MKEDDKIVSEKTKIIARINPMSKEDIRIMLGQLRVAQNVLKSASALRNSAEYLPLSSGLLSEQIKLVVHRLEQLQVTSWTKLSASPKRISRPKKAERKRL